MASLGALALGWLLVVAPAAADGPGPDPHDPAGLPPGWMLFDGGALLAPEDYAGTGSMPVELALDYFTTGSPAVRWETSIVPTVAICTRQAGRPAWVTAEQFQEAVHHGVGVWNQAGAKVGFAYSGDCAGTGSWRFSNNINEIGWDDSRNAVRSPAAAVTQGSWKIGLGARPFAETDIIFDHLLDVPEACFRSTMAHELGHALGLGHSTTFGDLMYPSFNSSDVSTCPSGAATAEMAVVQGLYGVNNPPRFAPQDQQSAAVGSQVTLRVPATDPDGDSLTYGWTQTAGPSVSLNPSGSTLSFTAPKAEGQVLAFQVEALDRYLHRATTSIQVMLTGVSAPPAGTPSLASILPGPSGRMALEWDTLSGAAEFEFCTTPTGGSQASCDRLASPVGEVTWDTVLTGPVTDARRLFTTGTRETALRACNVEGCSPLGVGPHAGGLRWTAYDVDYDYFAMAFDVPGTSVRFTIIGVANLGGPARKFSLYSGSAADPQATRVQNCGNVAVGQVCIGMLAPSDGGHASFASVVSERTGTPVLEHRIRIR